MFKNAINFIMGGFMMLQVSPVMAAGLPKVLVISTSLDKNSKSALLAHHAYELLGKSDKEVEAEFLDLRQFPLPSANGDEQSAYDDANVKKIHDQIEAADAIIISMPIYNYSPASSVKNLVELTTHSHKNILSGKAWQGKVVAFMSNAGSTSSQLAFLPIMNALVLDAKVIVVPQFVFTTSNDFKEKATAPSKSIQDRLQTMTSETIRLTKALKKS